MGDRLGPFAGAVARGIHLAILKEALEGLDRAERDGTPAGEAGATLAARLRSDWSATGPRLLLTTENAAVQGLALGRLDALTRTTAVKARPFWLFAAVLDDRISETCLECDGVLLPVGHPWWTGHICPLHTRCRSTLVGVTAAQARAHGITARPPTVEVEEGFGTLADLCAWEPRPGEYPAELLELITMADRSTRRLDLSPSDVHVPTTAPASKPLTPKQRRDARAAAKKAKADEAVGAAAVKAAGLNPVRRRGLHMRIGMATDGKHTVEVMHAAPPTESVLLRDGAFGVEVNARPMIEAQERGDALTAKAKAIPETDTAHAEERKQLLADAGAAYAEARAPRWNQIAKVGRFLGHPAGPFELTPAIFADIARNYLDVDMGQVALDFEHASEADETSGTIPSEGAPAQGWVKQLDNRGQGGLWGLIEFGEPALSYVLKQKYKGFSPAIRFGAKHPETGRPIGARLTSVALTNKPFLRGLAPLTASDTGAVTMSLDRPLMSSTFHADMRAALGLDGEATLDRCSAKCAELRELCMTADDAMMSQGVDLAPRMASLKALMGMANHATLGDILDAVEGMIDDAIERHEATYHSTTDDTDTGAMTASDTIHGAEEAQTIMSDTDKDLAVKLGEEKQKNTILASERAALANEKAELNLRLKDVEAENVKIKADLAAAQAAEAKAAKLLTDREEATLGARVEEAFSTYAESRKLSDDDKADMLLSLRNNAERFERRFPRVAADQRHLLQPRTTGRTATAETTRAMGDGRTPGQQVRPARVISVTEPSLPGDGRTMSMADLDALTTRLMKDEGLNLMRASVKAGEIAEGRTANPYAS